MVGPTGDVNAPISSGTVDSVHDDGNATGTDGMEGSVGGRLGIGGKVEGGVSIGAGHEFVMNGGGPGIVGGGRIEGDVSIGAGHGFGGGPGIAGGGRVDGGVSIGAGFESGGGGPEGDAGGEPGMGWAGDSGSTME